MQFTPSQEKAIAHMRGNLQLIACAGSGKTEVVARRVANLLGSKNGRHTIAPGNIVAFTFTEKAAAELKQRIQERCREAHGELRGMAEMYVGTIHGFCLDLLKSEVPKFLKYEVLNEVQQTLFVDRNSKKSGLTSTAALNGQPLRRYVDTGLYIQAASILREADIKVKLLAKCSMLEGARAYCALLDERGFLDYSAILANAADVLENDDDLRRRLSERVKHVIVDEYQDVNPIQEAIVRTLNQLGANICVVGDDDQTIYQWRGGDVQSILTFEERYSKPTQVRLEENFRSSEGIVETARPFIEQNLERLPKKMRATGAQVYEAGDIVALGFDDAADEAAYIARTCKQLRGTTINDGSKARGISWSDMAILLRSVRASGSLIASALHAEGVPYVVAGMNNLFDKPEAEAARQLFYMIAGRVSDAEVVSAWGKVGLGLPVSRIKTAVASVANACANMGAVGTNRFKVYNIQRQYLAFLEALGLREELIPADGGEVLFYNLGKFSQMISDFESIHFYSKPVEKYETFANFLQYHAEDAYPEGWQDNQYANPDAVQIMTVHQAKGMQWPAVFVPQLDKNRFPSKRQGGRNVWHLLPTEGVVGQARYAGTIEDERRLFYVAMTRSQKYLHLTWAPVAGNRLYQQSSVFFDDILASKYVKRHPTDYAARRKLQPKPKASVANVVLSFSDVKYFFECPYQFKLRILYGFNAPIDEALGYGKSLHDILAEVHGRAIRGDVASAQEVPELVARHLRAPYAYPALREQMAKAAEKVVRNYLTKNATLFDKIEFSEKSVELNLGDGVSVTGRIDLVRRVDTNEITIIDLKSTSRAQVEAVTEAQLHIYALGYRELTGRDADYVEIYNLDEGERKIRSVDDVFIAEVSTSMRNAGNALRAGEFLPKPHPKRCVTCDYRRICSAVKVS